MKKHQVSNGHENDTKQIEYQSYNKAHKQWAMQGQNQINIIGTKGLNIRAQRKAMFRD